MARFSSALDIVQVSDPATPATGRQYLYFKSDGNLYMKNPAGTVSQVSGATAPVNMVTTDTPQTVSGIKTFTAIPVLPAGTVTIASHSATGTPSATTFLRGDNTWSTPAGAPAVVSVTSATTVATNTIYFASGTFVMTVPVTAGLQATIKNTGTGTITVSPASGTIDGSASAVLSPYVSINVVSDGTNVWVV